jgi:hypothetical protein
MAMNRFWMGAVPLAAMMVAGCGGGADGGSEAGRTGASDQAPQAAADTLRTRLSAAGTLRAEAVSPEKSAEQLLDFAESRFPMYFPGHPATQTLAPFHFRAYGNGVYLGVATSGEGGYTANGVYVMGGPFGSSPTFVGLLTDFITPVDPDVPVGPTGPGNGCFDLAAAEAAGFSLVVMMQGTGTVPGTSTTETRNVGLTTFEGHEAMESVTRMTNESVFEGRTVRSESETRYYSRRTGEAELTEYGSVSPSQASPLSPNVTSSSRTVYNPPFVNRIGALAQGESLTQTKFATVHTVTQIPGLPASEGRMPMTITTTTTFVGVETVTVPAGTFTACKFQLSVPGTAPSTTWQHRGTGAGLKFEGPLGTSVATSVIVNGVALSH